MTSEQIEPPPKILGKRRVHCGYHKCLTMYVRKVMDSVCVGKVYYRGKFRHFFHHLEDFYDKVGQYELSSISGHAIDLDRFEDIRVSRFVRDPRDLVVSGYYYHKRGAEHWCHYEDPTEDDWEIVNGCIPKGVGGGRSLTQYLNEVSLEDGLAAEFEFRRYHFDSMLAWAEDDPRVRLFRYEDILGNEEGVFGDVLHHYGLPFLARRRGRRYARRYSIANKKKKQPHVRNPTSGQWRELFTPKLKDRFRTEYGDVLEKLGYPAD